MLWVRVPPEAADFSSEKCFPRVSLNCVVLCCFVYLEGLLIVFMQVQQFSQGSFLAEGNEQPQVVPEEATAIVVV